jgi:uncharacterized protein with von Willebrand factor type A (vWA) domain
MEELIRFVNILRKLGFSVSTVELTALVNSLNLIDPHTVNFQHLARSFLVKDKKDFAFFDSVFQAFFLAKTMGEGVLNTVNQNRQDEIDCFELSPGGSADGKGLTTKGAGGVRNKLAHLVRIGDYHQAGDMVEEALSKVRGKKLNGEEMLNQSKLQLDWHMERYRLEKMMQGHPHRQIVDWEEAWRRLEEKLHQGVIRELLARGTEDADEAAYREINNLFNFKRKSFNKLSESEYKLMKREVVDIGRRLATRKSRQWRKSKSGSIDLKNTVRNCLQGGGVPLKLYRRRHKTNRPNLVLLCDVSSSVVNYSAFMLLLVYSMEQSFNKVRSFIFVDDVEEVSPYFSKYGLEEAIELLTVRATCSTSGFSDFGRVFKAFEQKYLSLLNPKTNLLILGDAKNNYRATELESFNKLAASCRRIWWLNPQPEEFWGQDDSVIAEYAGACAAVWECSNLENLQSVARRIYG